jgi:hypothetical protein
MKRIVLNVNCLYSYELGWAPSTFVSSRGDRAKQKVARPEDFMDEEDLQEIKDSRNVVDTTEEMDLTGGRGGDLEESEKECVVLTMILRPSKSINPALSRQPLKRRFYLLQMSLLVHVF